MSGSVEGDWGHFPSAGKVGLKSERWEIEGFFRTLGISGVGGVHSGEGRTETGPVLGFRGSLSGPYDFEVGPWLCSSMSFLLVCQVTPGP